MDNLRAAHKSGVYPMYCSNANPDFSTIGYCMALGVILDNGVSTITAINSQTGDIWTNGNVTQNAGAWTGWKNNSPISLYKKLNLTTTATEVDMGAGDGVYLILVAQSAGLDCMGLYMAKITNYESGTKLKTILNPQSFAPTITVTARSSTVHGKITFTSDANINCAIYKFNIF